MLPRFSLTQDDAFIYLCVRTPFCRAAGSDLVVEGRAVHFWCRPYLLKICLPALVLDDERLRVVYDPDDAHGTFRVWLPKAVPGEDFPDLDMLSLLLGGDASRGSAGVSTAAASSRPEDDAAAVFLTAEASAALAEEAELAAEDAAQEAALRHAVESHMQRAGGGGSRVDPARRHEGPLIEVISSRDAIPAGEGCDGLRAGSGAPSSTSCPDGDDVNASSAAALPRGLCAAAAALGIGGGSACPDSTGAGSSKHAKSDRADDEAALPYPTHLIRGREALEASREFPLAASFASLPALATGPRFLALGCTGVGFNRRFDAAFFADQREETAAVVDLPRPHEPRSAAQRCAERVADEDSRFDRQRYAADALLVMRARLQPNAASASADAAAAAESADSAELDSDDLLDAAMAFDPWWLRAEAADRASDGSERLPVAWVWSESEAAWLASLRGQELLVDGVLVGGAAQPSGLADAEVAEPLRRLPSLAACTAAVPTPPPTAALLALGPEASRLIASLVPLLAAYAYDARLSEGEGSVESSWTLRTLCPLLAWLDDDCGAEAQLEAVAQPCAAADPTSSPAEARTAAAPAQVADAHARRLLASAAAFTRRVLTFPYLRRWDLATRCLADAAALLCAGRRALLRVLAAIAATLASRGDDTELHYQLNVLFTRDYALWLQRGGAGLDATLHASGCALAALLQREECAEAGAAACAAAGEGRRVERLRLHRDLPQFAHWRLHAAEAEARKWRRLDADSDDDSGEEEGEEDT